MYSFPWKVTYFLNPFFMEWYLLLRETTKQKTTEALYSSTLTCLCCKAEKIKLRFLTFVFAFLFSSGINEWRYDFTIVPVGIRQCLKQANLHFGSTRNLICNTFQVYFRCTGCFNICAYVMRSLHFFSSCQLESKLPKSTWNADFFRGSSSSFFSSSSSSSLSVSNK